jgi:ribosomal protein S17E
MGKVRTKTIKRSAKILVEKYYSRLTMDFQTVSLIIIKTNNNNTTKN